MYQRTSVLPLHGYRVNLLDTSNLTKLIADATLAETLPNSVEPWIIKRRHTYQVILDTLNLACTKCKMMDCPYIKLESNKEKAPATPTPLGFCSGITKGACHVYFCFGAIICIACSYTLNSVHNVYCMC